MEVSMYGFRENDPLISLLNTEEQIILMSLNCNNAKNAQESSNMDILEEKCMQLKLDTSPSGIKYM